MLDLRYVRANPTAVKEGARKKRASVDVDRLLALDAEALGVRQQVEQLRARLNETSKAVPLATGEEKQRLIRLGRETGERLRGLEPRLRQLEEAVQALLLAVPNPPADDVPEGKDETDNVPIKFWGQPPRFEFPPLDHVALMERHDLVDLERGAKVAGHRGYFLKREAALLDLALMRFALDRLAADGFAPMTAPALARGFAFTATGH